MTCMLLSSHVPACIHVAPIPPETNEDGFFRQLVDQLLQRYATIDLFRLVMADAGSCSLGNADYVRQKQLHYLFTLNEKQPTLLAEAARLLESQPNNKAVAVSEESVRGGIERRTLFATTDMAGYHDWTHLAVVLRVRRQRWDGRGHRGRTQRSEERRGTGWKRVMEWIHDALISSTAEVVSGLRPRVEADCEC
jgi:hypothetical protein